MGGDSLGYRRRRDERITKRSRSRSEDDFSGEDDVGRNSPYYHHSNDEGGRSGRIHDGAHYDARRRRRRGRGRRSYRSPSRERHREGDRDRDRDRDREHERDRKSGDRERDRHPPPEPLGSLWSPNQSPVDRSTQFRDPEEEKRLEQFKDIADMERPLRTICIWQLTQKVQERDIFELFSKAGKVRDVRLILDKKTGRHKGVGYVEFYYKEAIPQAVGFTGQLLRGFPVAAKPSEAEKNIAAQLAAKDAAFVSPSSHPLGTTASQEDELKLAARFLESSSGDVQGSPSDDRHPSSFTKLYVGSIHYSVGEEDLREICSPFGEILSLQLHRDSETGRSKGFAFVQYACHEAAKKALDYLKGQELAGRQLRVGLASVESNRVGASTLSPGNYLSASRNSHDTGGLSELDEGRDGGLSLNATQRALLMQRLSRGEQIAPNAPQMVIPEGTTVESMGRNSATANAVPSLLGYNPPLQVGTGLTASRCLMLRNMFDPAKESDPDFHLEVHEDVRDECLSKFGELRHIVVDKKSAGIVYLKFKEIAAAAKARSALHGRFYGGHQVTAEFVPEAVYYQRFSNAQD